MAKNAGSTNLQPAPSPAAPALNLSTTDFERVPIAIDGETYLMRSGEELSAGMMRQLQRVQRDIKASEKLGGDSPSEEDDEASLKVLEESTKRSVSIVMVDFPDEVNAKLSFPQRARIVETFMQLTRNETRVSGAQIPS